MAALGGSERSGQLEMADAVARAFETGEHLAVQAGTGTGKSLAYLVPAISRAVSDDAPVVVSTATIALQRQLVNRDLPQLVVSRMTRSLRPGKVLIDWSQNNGSKTTIAPYSLRAREHPTVSTPVTWNEVAACRDVSDLFFTAPDVLARVEEHGDLFGSLVTG